MIAISGVRGLMSSEFSQESASAMGIKVVLVKNFVRADLYQAIAGALG